MNNPYRFASDVTTPSEARTTCEPIPEDALRSTWSLERLRSWTIEDENGCWIWQRSLSSTGYGRACIGNRYYGAHRVAYSLTSGPIPPGMYVLHSCDVRPCCNPEHLRAGTPAENNADTLARGRHSFIAHRGEENPGSKLTEAAVRDIRASTAPRAELAARYGVSLSLINQVLNRRAWRWVA